jgi:O-antigen ligase
VSTSTHTGRSVTASIYAGVAAAGAFIVGGLFAIRSTLGGATLGVVCFVALAMLSIPVAMAVWISALFVKNVPGLADTWMLLVMAAAWLGSAIATRLRIGDVIPGQRVLVASLALLLVWLSMSVLWASDARMAWQELEPWFTAAAVVMLVATTIGSASQLRLVLAALLCGALLSSVIGLIGAGPHTPPAVGYPAPPSDRFTGAEGNPNDLASQLLPVIVLAGGLAADRLQRSLRLVLVVAAAGVTIAFAATQSRGGLVAAAIVLLAAAVIYRRHRREVAVAIALVVAVAGLTVALYPSALSRITSFDDGGAGRSTLWLVAWRIGRDLAPEGAGLNNFRVVAPNYVRQPGSLRYVGQIDYPHIVHNTYLQLLAETGVIGLCLFVAVAAACLSAARRAMKVFERVGRADLARLSRVVLLAGVAVLATQLFDTTVDDMRFWVVLALGPALLTVASHQPIRR